MKYTHRYNPKVMAHKIGDPLPDWVSDLVRMRQVIFVETENGVQAKVPAIITEGEARIEPVGNQGDYVLFDGNDVTVLAADAFEQMYDSIYTEDSKETAQLMTGVGVVSRDEMFDKLSTEMPDAIQIGNSNTRKSLYPAIIGLDREYGRIVYDEELLIQQVYRSGTMSQEESEEYVKALKDNLLKNTNDTNKNHMPLIIERQECY